jgi:hypothetical protein
MRPGLRKLNLTAHVVVSVGWLGAAAAVLALGVTGLLSHEERTISAAYLGTEVIWRGLVVPLSLVAFATGVLQAFGTQWGLLRHYWILTKLLLTSSAIILLLLHTNSLLPALIAEAMDPSIAIQTFGAHHGGIPPRVHLLVASGGTLLLLLMNTALSVYKPWGQTRRADDKVRAS